MITIKKIGGQTTGGHPDSSDTAGAYLVTENGREFTVIYKSHIHGTSIELVGQQGTLHADQSTGAVYRQMVALSGACGLNVDEEPVPGLSAWALQGVLIAERDKTISEILFITQGRENDPAGPTMFIDGEPADLKQYLPQEYHK
jgi:hypothetical protein